MFPESKNAKSEGTFNIQVLVELTEAKGPDIPKEAIPADLFSRGIDLWSETNTSNTSKSENSLLVLRPKEKQEPNSYFLRSYENGGIVNINRVQSNGVNEVENELQNNPNLD